MREIVSELNSYPAPHRASIRSSALQTKEQQTRSHTAATAGAEPRRYPGADLEPGAVPDSTLRTGTAGRAGRAEIDHTVLSKRITKPGTIRVGGELRRSLDLLLKAE